jgi:hypothetical protein
MTKLVHDPVTTKIELVVDVNGVKASWAVVLDVFGPSYALGMNESRLTLIL